MHQLRPGGGGMQQNNQRRPLLHLLPLSFVTRCPVVTLETRDNTALPCLRVDYALRLSGCLRVAGSIYCTPYI